ncbi:reticulon-like protein B5 [Cajanus cajan]|uniref:reticulon-like protein B5 n=1 Tax=Cajanus cajan TaxID=3821 RepID=UPI00098D7734|nr:reticulon-like protein B5 [Cajanus cajan]XP_029125233.1 reticulon-like protein B5 [Cajanus cajan]
MPLPAEFMDVADSDFLSNKELDDEDSEFETDFENYFVFSAAKNRFFGRRRPLRVTLGSGLIADIILWRNNKISGSILAGVTFIWMFFKRMDYTLISFICDSLILLLAMLFLWSHLTSFIKIPPPPELSAFILPKGLLVNIAISVTRKLNQLLIAFGVLASGRDMKKFLMVTVTLGAVSVLDCWFTAATLIYIVFVILLIVPSVYEKHGDIIDILVEKALFDLKNLYADLVKKVFGKPQHLEERILD